MALALGGYALLLAARRGPPPAAPAPDVTAPEPPPAPQRLPHRPNFEPASVPSFAGIAPDSRAVLRARITSLAKADVARGAGLAVLDGETHAVLRWLPLLGAAADGDALRVEVGVPAVPLRLTIAPAEHAAARGWWVARDVAAAELAAEIAIAVPLQDVAVRVVHEGAPGGIPFALRRDGEPQWRAGAPAVSLVPSERGVLWLRLGPGRYTLAPLTAPADTTPFPFEVPGPGVFEASFSAATDRDGRP